MFGTVKSHFNQLGFIQYCVMLGAALVTAYLLNVIFLATNFALSERTYVLPLVCLITLGVLTMASLKANRYTLALILIIAFIAQLSWSHFAITTPTSDFGTFVKHANTLTEGLNWKLLQRTKSPTTIIALAGTFNVFGNSLPVIWALGAALWTLQTFIFWHIVRLIPEIATSANAAAMMIGLMPSIVIYSGVPSSEQLLGVFVLTATYLALRINDNNYLKFAFACGVLVCLGFLSRQVAVAHFAALIII